VGLSASATDAISGLSILEASTDDEETWESLPIHFADGDHQALIRARDVAGNEITVTRSIRVDTVSPIAQITSHINGDVVQGEVRLSGSLEDLTSGPEGGEVSVDGGITWQPVSLDTSAWTFTWHSGEVPNGEYTIQMRGSDRAGNGSNVSSITLTVDNAPPAVSITEQWWIWETGTLKVSSNHFPITSIQVTIQDKQKRWKEVVVDLSPGKSSYIVKWDRRFGDGTLAPAGEYPVRAVACDVNGLCGQDAGRIVIPEMATGTATLTTTPTMTATATFIPTRTATEIKVSPMIVSMTPTPEAVPMPAQEPIRKSFPWWQALGLVGLMMVIASASVVDPRPQAVHRLADSMKQISDSNHPVTSQDGD
jgi:hypothetical protein